MVPLSEMVTYCDQRLQHKEIVDFPGAHNGLQVGFENSIRKIGAAVDAGHFPFKKAIAQNINFLIVHHGLFWNPPVPITESNYQKLNLLFNNHLAVYSSHLPLDCHPEIGNNAILAQKLHLQKARTFLSYQGRDMGLITTFNGSRDHLHARLKGHFPRSLCAIQEGSDIVKEVAIVTGSGQSAIPVLSELKIDTLITGELKQHSFNIAQEKKLNLYLCGHYATEVFGVCALANELSQKFSIPWEFISTECPL